MSTDINIGPCDCCGGSGCPNCPADPGVPRFATDYGIRPYTACQADCTRVAQMTTVTLFTANAAFSWINGSYPLTYLSGNNKYIMLGAYPAPTGYTAGNPATLDAEVSATLVCANCPATINPQCPYFPGLVVGWNIYSNINVLDACSLYLSDPAIGCMTVEPNATITPTATQSCSPRTITLSGRAFVTAQNGKTSAPFCQNDTSSPPTSPCFGLSLTPVSNFFDFTAVFS